ncbi:MAG: DNA polymerase III subunit delta' C-terminal domain-containing protein, partial [Armatimonadota bacterium]
VIIEQADTLNASSENSILKILEEPPDYAVLILLSSNPETLLPTIRSRCRKVRFRTAGFEETLNYLKEHTDLSDDDARIIGACSQGLIGKASELVSDPRFMQERATVLQKLADWSSGPDVMGLTLAESMRAMAESKKKNDPDVRTRIRRLSTMLEYILSWYADILSLKVRGDGAFLSNKDHEGTIRYLADLYSISRLTLAVRVIMDSRRYLEGNITPQLVLENMFFEIRPDRLEVGR